MGFGGALPSRGTINTNLRNTMLIKLNDERVFTGFASFCQMNESIKPRHTEFGTDGKNGEWSHEVGHHIHTFFSHKDDHHALVAVHKQTGEISFATHRGKFTNDIDPYNMNKTDTGDAFTVMGKVIHTALRGVKKLGLKSIQFKGHTKDLRDMYSAVVKNKHLSKHLKEHGFEYSHSDGDVRHYVSK